MNYNYYRNNEDRYIYETEQALCDIEEDESVKYLNELFKYFHKTKKDNDYLNKGGDVFGLRW